MQKVYANNYLKSKSKKFITGNGFILICEIDINYKLNYYLNIN